MAAHDDLGDLRLSQFAGYVRREQGLYGAAWGLCGGLAVALALNVAAWLFPILTATPRLLLSIGLAALCALLAFMVTYLYPRPAMRIARLSDARMGLRARLATALEIEAGQLPVPGELVARQRADARQAAERANPREAFALRCAAASIARRQARIAALLAALLVVGFVVPNPQEGRIARRQAEQEAIQRQVERLEEVRQSIAENERLSEADRDILLRELDDAIAELGSGELSREEALARLSAMEGRLQELLDQDVDARQRAMDEAGRAAAQGESTQEIGQALSEEAYSAAAEALASLAQRLPQMSPEELEALAGRLEAMSGELRQVDPALAQALRDAAQALREGDVEAAQEALRRAGELTEAAGQQMAAQEAAEGALGQVQEGRREIAQANPDGQGQGQGQQGQGQGQQGQGQGQGQQGQGQGQGQQGQQGQGQGGQGTGSGAGSGDSPGGGEGPPQGPGGPIDPNAPGEAGETPYDPIYDPERLGDAEGPIVDVPGEGEGGPATGETEGGPRESGEALVPYNEVYADYQAQAASALENSYIPRGLKDYVRAYFGAVDPER